MNSMTRFGQSDSATVKIHFPKPLLLNLASKLFFDLTPIIDITSKLFLIVCTYIEASTPNGHLFVTIFGSGLSLVEAGESSIVALVQSPRLLYWYVRLADLLEDDLEGVLSPGQDRSERQVKLVVGIF